MTALHRSATHLQTLINDILDLSQLEAGQMPILRDVSEMTSVITEAVSIARPLLERRGLTLTVDVPATLPLLSIDRVRIRQVILNLINNAIRFTDEGGITITAYTENHELVIAVRDTGIGIRQEDIARLFAAYQQLDQSPTRSRGGTGLGLAISRHFVELHGGRIWAESAGPGSGSTFAFTLPLLTTAIDTTLLHANDPAERWAIDPVNAPRPTLVLWERDEAVTTLFQRYLPTFAIVGAATFEEACKLAEQRAALAIIVDSSDALPPAVRETIQSLEARVLCCPLPSGRRSVQAAGIADYLVKPVTRETLLRSVRDVCPHAQKILVVDDQRDMVRLLCRMLRSAPKQYTLIRGFSGHEALDLMRQNRPDVVILDLLMPEMDGLSVLEHMKTELDLAMIPVVVVSAKGAAEAVTPSTARSMTLINDRSFAITELLHTVNALLTSLPPRAPEMVSSGGALQEG
jgi:CheY-like chemotaxis protein